MFVCFSGVDDADFVDVWYFRDCKINKKMISVLVCGCQPPLETQVCPLCKILLKAVCCGRRARESVREQHGLWPPPQPLETAHHRFLVIHVSDRWIVTDRQEASKCVMYTSWTTSTVVVMRIRVLFFFFFKHMESITADQSSVKCSLNVRA